MQLLVTAIKDGTIKGLKTAAMMLKIVIPVYIVVVFLKHSPVMGFLENTFSPAMKFFQLPGDAIVPLITGLFTDEYATIAAMSSFSFTAAQITTIAMIVLVAHSMPVEAAIAQKIGLSAAKFSLFRIVAAILTGLLIGWIGGIFL